MNLNDIGTQLLYTTVPIIGTTNDGVTISGTGFIYSHQLDENGNKNIPLLITNHHVVRDMVNGYIEFNIHENGLPIKSKSIRVGFSHKDVNTNKLGNLDLVAIPIASVLNESAQRGINIFYKSVTRKFLPTRKQVESLSAIEDLIFIGYPSGLYDEYNHNSIIRQGITATPIWNDYKGKPDFLIDGGVFPGSSGSPVFILNQGSYPTSNGISIGSRLFFVGVIYESNVYGQNFLNLGIAMNSIAVSSEIEKFIVHLMRNKDV